MTTKQIVSIILDICIFICATFSILFLYSYEDADINHPVIVAAILVAVASLAIYEIVCWSKPTKLKKIRTPEISTLILLGEDDRPIKIWDLSGKVGLLIGKSSNEYQVDIDLADTDYHAYIDPEHVLLNYTDSGWWVQNVSTRNEVSIQRKGNELLLGHHAADRLHKSDILRIAQYTRIAVN
jgi:hypothetical protein